MSHRNERNQHSFRRIALSATVAVAFGCAAQAGIAQTHSCIGLLNANLPNVVIRSAVDVPMPGALGPSDNYCQVDGLVVSPGLNGEPGNAINFRVALPEKIWNGKLLVEGNGAHAGVLPGFSALSRGYAEAGTDTGHIGIAFGNA